MSELLTIGVSNKTAPLDMRDSGAFSRSRAITSHTSAETSGRRTDGAGGT